MNYREDCIDKWTKHVNEEEEEANAKKSTWERNLNQKKKWKKKIK